MLDLIRHKLIKSPVARKRMVLTACYLAFFGCFRIHEILAREKMEFDVQTWWRFFQPIITFVQSKHLKNGGKFQKLPRLKSNLCSDMRTGGKEFNADLKKLLGKYLAYNKGKILAHYFRSGLAIMMAKCGYSHEDIMRRGRWSSSAFLAYCKLGRVKRMVIAQDMATRLSKL
jgi:hypothetical protein